MISKRVMFVYNLVLYRVVGYPTRGIWESDWRRD